MASFLVAFCLLLVVSPACCKHIEDATELEESYDYIVAGGGTSGLTIGDRLSESGECQFT